MKFHCLGQKHGVSIKDQIVRKFREEGFISYGAVREIAGEFATKEDWQNGWDDNSDLDKKIRVRETKKGWFVYLPEPNATVHFNKDESSLPNIDVSVFPTESFEELIKVIEEGFESLKLTEIHLATQNEEFLYNQLIPSFFFCTRPCIVKAKKSGRKEERQDRKAKFHRWADLSKGVQQVVAIVEFNDGHIEQVQPDRIIFKEEE